jgi:O-acetylserine/cysteine efflux transporter
VSLVGVALIAGGGGGGATMGGDGLVLASLLLSATVTVAQARLLPGRDPVAVTAVQFLAAAVAALVFALFTTGAPAVPAGPGPVLAVVALAAGGTLLPFTLFAFGQSRVSAEVAGAFLNLEPLVGAMAGVVVFGNPFGPGQAAGGAAIMAGIALSSLPLLTGRRSRRARALATEAIAAGAPAAGTLTAGALAAEESEQADLGAGANGYDVRPEGSGVWAHPWDPGGSAGWEVCCA